jgi:PIN domain nuclease of toxin-antitoxin system
VRLLLDTHFLIWIVVGSARLDAFPWLHDYAPWGVSPVSLLEIQFLGEVGRLDVRNPAFSEAVAGDPRFLVDEAPLVRLIEHALPLTWTRDPFDRLLAAHSSVRRIPLCTVDKTLIGRHDWIAEELR